MIYLDNAATTPVSAETAQLVSTILTQHYANPSAVYKLGMESEDIIDTARRQLGIALSVKPGRIFFTSGGTESNNIGLSGLYYARRGWSNNIVMSGYEHPSVWRCIEHLSQLFGFEVRRIMPSSKGVIDPQAVLDAVDSKTALVTVMQVNNETGSIFDIAAIAGRIKQKNSRTAIFCDGIQGCFKILTNLSGNNIDGYSLSGHKFGAPKGVGALYLREGVNYEPASNGGGQEGGIRSGTPNIAFIAALGNIAEQMSKTILQRHKYVTNIKDVFLNKLDSQKFVVNSPDDCSPYIVNISITGEKSPVLQRALDDMGILLSSGSSCSKGGRSRTLVAMSLPTDRIDSALRISFSAGITEQDCIRAAEGIMEATKRLIK